MWGRPAARGGDVATSCGGATQRLSTQNKAGEADPNFVHLYIHPQYGRNFVSHGDVKTCNESETYPSLGVFVLDWSGGVNIQLNEATGTTISETRAEFKFPFPLKV